MAEKKAPAVFDSRVAQGFALKQQIEELSLELEKIAQELLKKGAGRYADEEGRTCTAVANVPAGVGPVSYALRVGEDDKARQISGEAFAELFERKVTYEPKPGFADRADALLTPARKRDIIALCFVAGKAKPSKAGFVIWK